MYERDTIERRTNQGVAAAWCAGLDVDMLWSGNGNLRAEGQTIYSYGHHFPIACHGGANVRGKDSGCILLTSIQYSSEEATGKTTARHVSLVYSAARKEGLRVHVVPIVDARLPDEHKANLRAMLSLVAAHMRRAARRRSKDYSEGDKQQARDLMHSAIIYKSQFIDEPFLVHDMLVYDYPKEAKALRFFRISRDNIAALL